jgi:Undecaprenyl-phosphate glucose phosphotransferase
MTVRDVSIEDRDRKVADSLHFNELDRTVIAVAQMAADGGTVMALSFLSLAFAIWMRRHDDITYVSYIPPTAATAVTLVFSYARSGVYDVFNASDRIGVMRRTFIRLGEVILLLTGCFFILKVSDDFSRLWLITWSITNAIALSGLRLISATAVQRLIRDHRLTKNIAVVGANEAGQRLSATLMQQGPGIRLIGLFDQRHPSRIVKTSSDAAVRPLTMLDELVSRGRVDEVVIAIPPSASNRILQLSRRFHPFPVSLRVLAPEGYEHFRVLDSCRYGEITTFHVMSKPLDEVALVIKWLEDKVIAAVCFVIALPLMLLIALAIKLDSRGPVFFRQKRLGAKSQPFDLLKFRSMYVEHTDPLGRQLTRAGDSRITRVGRFLRWTSMDELPQLVNVLRGDMSLVGPRPHPLAANVAGMSYAGAISEYLIRHRVKPGMTGWAQVNGWRGETTRIEQIRRRVEHDLYYIEHWSLAFDFLILLRTAYIVMSRENAI